MLKKYSLIFLTVILLILLSAPVSANKSSAAIEAPDNAANGTVITIKVTVTHKGNSFFHYTNWAYVKVNGKEIARWDFTSGKRPESEVFSREVKYTVEGPMTIEAESNCNLHGSAGTASKKVEVQ